MEKNIIFKGRQVRNDVKNLTAIADEYEQKMGHTFWLANALQKDSIQNSWDARINPTGRNWFFNIEIIYSDSEKFLAITDGGTKGLTGTIWRDEAELTNILKRERSEENLAYFLSSDFSAKDSASGGKRGRGKALFLIASRDSIFYFESLRSSDKKYVVGKLYITDNAVMVELSTDNKEYLKDILGKKFEPLSCVGTRIIIKNPKAELIDAFSNGLMVNFIENTWWETIKKHNVPIKVSDGKTAKLAKIPKYYENDYLDKTKNKSIEVREYPNIQLPESAGSANHRIKRLVLVYNPTETPPDEIQGIAVQRNGMTIERRSAELLVKEEGMNKVYGWVEMDKELETSMYDLEDVEHLSFKWTKKPANVLLDIVKIKIREFAKEVKLIEGELSRKHRVYTEIENDVASKINDFLKNLGFSGGGLGKRPRRGKTRIHNFPLRISFVNFAISSDEGRVDFGEKIQALASAVNDLDVSINVIQETWIVDSNGKTVKNQEKEVCLNSKTESLQGWNDLEILPTEFAKGDYSFRSKITVMNDDLNIELPRIGKLEKGVEIKSSLLFSVEKDTPSRGFIKFEAIKSADKRRYVCVRPENNFIVIEYNTEHPYIAKFMPVEEKEELRKFLLQVGIVVAFSQVLTEDLSNEKPKIFCDVDDTIEATEVVSRIMDEVSKFMWTQK